MKKSTLRRDVGVNLNRKRKKSQVRKRRKKKKKKMRSLLKVLKKADCKLLRKEWLRLLDFLVFRQV